MFGTDNATDGPERWGPGSDREQWPHTIRDQQSAFRNRLRGADDELTAPGGELPFPAGVVALGRGGAGDAGALLRPDGVLVGLLRLAATGPRGRDDVAALAAALPGVACQCLTVRRPIDLERGIAAWHAATGGEGRSDGRGALAADFADSYLPALAEAGWSETQTLFALFGDDPDELQRDLERVARSLPLEARPLALAELKRLAGDWFAPLATGLVTIGWVVTGLTAEPHPDWMRLVLGSAALAGLPLMVTLHLGPQAVPDRPVQRHDPLGGDRRAPGLRPRRPAGGQGPRLARLVIGCTVEPRVAREVRDEVEAILVRIGLVATSFGPGRSRDTLLTLAPLGQPVIGRGLTLNERGAALLTPLTSAGAGRGHVRGARAWTGLPPLGLSRDGGGVAPLRGEHLLLYGAAGSGKSAAMRTWALAQVAAGVAVTVVDTAGAWVGAAIAGGGEVIPVREELPRLLGGLGFDPERRGRRGEGGDGQGAWVTGAAALLGDLCPTLSDDDRGDLTATLLGLAEDHLAGRDVVHLHRLVRRLAENGYGRTAAALGALLLPGAGRERDAGSPPSVVVYDASGNGARWHDTPPEGRGGRLEVVTAAGLAAASVRAAIEGLRTQASSQAANATGGRLLIVDSFDAVLAASAGPGLLLQLFDEARRADAAVWCASSTPPPTVGSPAGVAAALRDLAPTAVVFGHGPDELRTIARWFGQPPTIYSSLHEAVPGTAIIARGAGYDAIRVHLSPLLESLSFRERAVRRRKGEGLTGGEGLKAGCPHRGGRRSGTRPESVA